MELIDYHVRRNFLLQWDFCKQPRQRMMNRFAPLQEKRLHQVGDNMKLRLPFIGNGILRKD